LDSTGSRLAAPSPALYPEVFTLIRDPVAQRQASAKGLQFRVALPHDLVPWRRVLCAPDIAAEPGYEAYGIAEPSWLVDSFFFA
jgi:hypothetical protein